MTVCVEVCAEDFEEPARNAPELVQLEFINGKVVVKPAPDGNHIEVTSHDQDTNQRDRTDKPHGYAAARAFGGVRRLA